MILSSLIRCLSFHQIKITRDTGFESDTIVAAIPADLGTEVSFRLRAKTVEIYMSAACHIFNVICYWELDVSKNIQYNDTMFYDFLS